MKKGLLKKLALVFFLAVFVPGLEVSRTYITADTDRNNDGDTDDEGEQDDGEEDDGGKSPEEEEAEAAAQELSDAQAELADAAGKSEAEQQAAQKRVEAAREALANSLGPGDPVLATTGRYVFEETDLEIPGSGWPIGRGYVTEEEADGQLGRGWASSLDSRIIRGIAPVDDGKLAEIKRAVDRMGSGGGYQYPAAQATGRETTAVKNYAFGLYAGLKAVSDRAALLRGLNGFVMYSGSPDYYQNTGNDTLTLTDEKGVPYLFEYEGNGEWKPADAQSAAV
ncbi:MAG: DUF6531 domain-containing protein [Spirochaetaceae bacterium]|jgi:hypothetical protein|nr:DUF6531 domain-containing protein [Spirochaetaceae bacterium]